MTRRRYTTAQHQEALKARRAANKLHSIKYRADRKATLIRSYELATECLAREGGIVSNDPAVLKEMLDYVHGAMREIKAMTQQFTRKVGGTRTKEVDCELTFDAMVGSSSPPPLEAPYCAIGSDMAEWLAMSDRLPPLPTELTATPTYHGLLNPSESWLPSMKP